MQNRLLVEWFKQLADQLGNKENTPSEAGALGFASGQPLDIVRLQLLDGHKKGKSPPRSSAPGQVRVSP